jgi:hypothetical protein
VVKFPDFSSSQSREPAEREGMAALLHSFDIHLTNRVTLAWKGFTELFFSAQEFITSQCTLPMGKSILHVVRQRFGE